MKEAKFKVGDKVRILNGSKIENYTAGWARPMAAQIGQIATVKTYKSWGNNIGYQMKEFGCWWDERGLELVKMPIVHIWCEGNKVCAKNVLNGKTAFARCSPEDKFDFLTGAKLALERLDKIGKPLAVGDEVRVIDTGEIYPKNWRWVCENVKDDSLKARWAYGVEFYPKVKKLDEKFIVRAIADDKVYIEHDNFGFGACHLIGLKGLERW